MQPTGEGSGLAIQVGAPTPGDTAVQGAPARWCGGTWTRDGRWVDGDTWLTVVWEREGFVYQLAGPRLDLAEVLRVAESLPATP